MYLPLVLNEALVNNVGVIDSTALPAYQTRADDTLDGWATEEVGASPATPLYLEHFPSGTGSAVPAPTLVNRLIVDSVIATQRRRLRR